MARHAIMLLLLTLAEGELMAGDEGLRNFYESQRESVWSPFLKLGLKKLEELEPEVTQEHDENVEE